MKYRVSKWYYEYYGYHDILAKSEQEALEIERNVLHDEGMDPDEFHFEAELVEEPPHEMFKREDEWAQFREDGDAPRSNR